MDREYSPTDVMDRAAKPNRYYRNAVERHWDPGDIDLSQDVPNLLDSEHMDPENFESMKAGLAKFGAGEDAVTEDLAPLAVVLDDIDDQLFIASHIYDEAKHADFFDRYWREVINPVEESMGVAQSSPRDDKWFNDAYHELFDRNKRAMHRLLDEDTPENRARAYTHYMLAVEGIAAQTGYYAFQTNFGTEVEETPHLPGLVEGFSNIRSDEGRHVGFGMTKLKELVADGMVSPSLIDEVVDDLVPLIEAVVDDERYRGDEDVGLSPDELTAYATEKHVERIQQIRDVSSALPDVEELVELGD